ncbi:MAG: sigma-70 family RNA polymerase sigma factor [Chitinophagaceae bacterium]|nr:MAG: sigma-70 family RNA polymerase sigma factor [Chitinophagaceae bacterium]
MPSFNGIQDPLFLSAFQKGEEAAFDCLFRTYFSPLTYFAGRFISDRQAAEDIVQDCFVTLWDRRDRLGHISLIKSYLYMSVRNASLKSVEKTKSTINLVPDVAASPNIEAAIIAADTARQLYQLVETLTPALQRIIRLYYLEGKSNREIATDLQLEPDTITRQRLRALVALRKIKISL